MRNLIEVEIDNGSYTPFLNPDYDSKKTITLTTLADNQIGAVIKIILNKNGTRITLKEFRITGISPKPSGIPKFELYGSYSGKKLNIELKVDGVRAEKTEIWITPYLWNKRTAVYISITVLAILFLIWGGEAIIKSFHFPINLKTPPGETQSSSYEDSDIQTVKPEISNNGLNSETGEAVEKEADHEQQNNFTTKEAILPKLIERIIYFTPNNTAITGEASLVLDKLISLLKENKTAKVEISGHCALTGTEEGRERLSRERAFKTLNYLEKGGWAPEEEPAVKWYGGTRPLSTDPAEIYLNRRVEIRVTF